MVANINNTAPAREQWQLEGSSAEAYERYLVPRLFTEWADLLMDVAKVRPGDHVLDAACGTGIVARRVSARIGENGEVVGLDLNEGMLEVARTKSSESHAAITWKQGNVEALPFDDETFDVVFCQQGLQFMPDPVAALSELRRVLKPTGRIALNVCRSVAHAPTYRVLADSLGRHVGETAQVMMESPFAVWDIEELRQFMVDADFREPHIHIEHVVGRFPSPADYLLQEVASSPLADELATLDEKRRMALIDEVSTNLRDFVDDDGIACPIPTYFATARK